MSCTAPHPSRSSPALSRKVLDSQTTPTTNADTGAPESTCSHLLYPLCNSYYQSLTTRSVSVGDVRITRSSPTPTNSSAISSRQASTGDISTCSAPTPPCSALSSAAASPCISAVTSPESRRRHWRLMVHRVRDDLEGVCQRIKKSSSDHRDDSLPGDTSFEVAGQLKRMLVVEFQEDRAISKEGKHSKLWSRLARRNHNSIPDHLDALSAQHVISPTLVLRSIANCMFHAEAHLSALPAGNIILRIINNRIFIIVSNTANNNACRSLLYGKLDLPIYVKPRSLRFTFCEDTNVLKVVGSTKSYGISLSSSELCSYDTDGLKLKSRSVLETIKSIDKGFGSVDNIPSSVGVKKDIVEDRGEATHTVPVVENDTDVTLQDIDKIYYNCNGKDKNGRFRSRSFTK